MSAISIVPFVRAITGVVGDQQAPRQLGSFVRSLPSESRPMARLLVARSGATVLVPARLEPVSLVRETFARHLAAARKTLDAEMIPRREVERLATVVALEQTPYAAQSPMVVTAAAALSGASGDERVKQAAERLVSAVEQEHATRFTQALTRACRAASLTLGFKSQKVIADKGQVRVVATDPLGRSLVSEIHGGVNREPRVETEIVGVTDGSCQELLDAFDQALDDQGVCGARRERRTTGGVCTLAAAREFFGMAPRKRATLPAPPANAQAPHRAARLNARHRARSQRGG